MHSARQKILMDSSSLTYPVLREISLQVSISLCPRVLSLYLSFMNQL